MTDIEFRQKTITLIDSLKTVCANYGLGNDGNEYKIITQTVLYKFINDKFRFYAKKSNNKLANAENFWEALESLDENEYQFLIMDLGGAFPELKSYQLLSYLYNNQNNDDFAKLFDDTLYSIAVENADIFSIKKRIIFFIFCIKRIKFLNNFICSIFFI